MDLTVLLVDDSRVMRRMIARTLAEADLGVSEVLEASNGKEALEIGLERGKDLDLILTDLNMPEMSGIEFVQAARRLTRLRDVPILVVASEASLEVIEEARDAGASAYVTKPFTAEKIRDKINALMEKKGGRA